MSIEWKNLSTGEIGHWDYDNDPEEIEAKVEAAYPAEVVYWVAADGTDAMDQINQITGGREMGGPQLVALLDLWEREIDMPNSRWLILTDAEIEERAKAQAIDYLDETCPAEWRQYIDEEAWVRDTVACDEAGYLGLEMVEHTSHGGVQLPFLSDLYWMP